jgi:hypothetical protein
MSAYLNLVRRLEEETDSVVLAAERGDWEQVVPGLAARGATMAEMDQLQTGDLKPAEQAQVGLVLQRVIHQDERLAALCREAFHQVRGEMLEMRDARATVEAYRQAGTGAQRESRFVDKLN